MKNFDLKKLDTITKYPSIPTYHFIKGKGNLLPYLTEGIDFKNKKVYYTEKVDGENVRIVVIKEQNNIMYYLGSREELVYASDGSLLIPKPNIVEMLTPVAEKLCKTVEMEDGIFVFFQELYGGKINGYKQYSSNGELSLRAFDMFYLPLNEVENLLGQEIQRLSTWREKGNQPYATVTELHLFCDKNNIKYTPIRGMTENGSILPSTLEEVFLFLAKDYKKVTVGLNVEGENEGIVCRTEDRKVIAKMRFEDYEKTLQLRGKTRKLILKEINKLNKQEDKTNEDINRVLFLEKLLSLEMFAE